MKKVTLLHFIVGIREMVNGGGVGQFVCSFMTFFVTEDGTNDRRGCVLI